ncbi:hypothetical protein PP1_024525 [Pseudonocardia sp. P1]
MPEGAASTSSPSEALRVRVHGGHDPIIKRRHNLVDIVPAGPGLEKQAYAVRDRMLREIEERPNPRNERDGGPPPGEAPRAAVLRGVQHAAALPRVREEVHRTIVTVARLNGRKASRSRRGEHGGTGVCRRVRRRRHASRRTCASPSRPVRRGAGGRARR